MVKKSKLKKFIVSFTTVIVVFVLFSFPVAALDFTYDDVTYTQFKLNPTATSNNNYSVVTSNAGWFRVDFNPGYTTTNFSLNAYLDTEIGDLTNNDFSGGFLNYLFRVRCDVNPGSIELNCVNSEGVTETHQFTFVPASDSGTGYDEYILRFRNYNFGRTRVTFRVRNPEISSEISSFVFYSGFYNSDDTSALLKQNQKNTDKITNGWESPESPDSSDFDDFSDKESQLLDDTQGQAANEINSANVVGFGSLQGLASSFSAVSSFFTDLLLNNYRLEGLVYISLIVGIVPVIVGMTVNGLRSRDRASARANMNAKRSAYYESRSKYFEARGKYYESRGK